MKLLLLIAIPVLSLATFLSACEKENSVSSTTTPCATLNIHDTIRIRDTIRIHDTVFVQPPTRLQTLTNKEWQLDEVNRNISGFNTRYIRNGSNNTGTSYNLTRIKFNVDGSGTYVDETGGSHSLNWIFNGTDQRIITLTIGPPFANSFVWYTVEIAGNYMHQTSVSGSSSLLSSRFIQTP